jgi:hypothetical protein
MHHYSRYPVLSDFDLEKLPKLTNAMSVVNVRIFSILNKQAQQPPLTDGVVAKYTIAVCYSHDGNYPPELKLHRGDVCCESKFRSDARFTGVSAKR